MSGAERHLTPPNHDLFFPKMYGRSAVVDIRLLIDGQNNLGEPPLWDAAEQKLYWTESLDR
jgi:hypothetical protein